MYYLAEQDREQLMTWSDQLKREPHIHQLIEKLEGCLENSREAMLELGIVETCKHCDEEEGGSCCGAGLENKFDTILLLMNLLLGVSLPERHHRPDSCYLLTDKGCRLKVRLVLCVDFLCPKILNTLSRGDLMRLQQVSGDELTTGFMLYDAIKKFLRKKNRAVVNWYRKDVKQTERNRMWDVRERSLSHISHPTKRNHRM